MRKVNFPNRILLSFAAITLMSVSSLYAQDDFKAWEFKTGQTGIAGGKLSFTNHSLTVEFWLNMSQAAATTESMNIMETFGDPYGINFCIRKNSANSNALELRLFAKDAQATPGTVYFYIPADKYTDKWAHIAFVISEADQKGYVYVNGDLLAQTNAIGGYYGNYKSDGVTSRTFNVGGAFWSSPKFLGKMADIRVWSVARTAQEIKDNYNKHLEGTPSGLFINYTFSTYERGLVNAADPVGTANKGWCNPEASWNTYYGTETLSSCPRNLALSDGSLSWDTSAGTWEIAVFKADDNSSVYSGTIASNSVSLRDITDLADGVSYYAKVRTLNNGFYSGWVTSDNFSISRQVTGLDVIKNKLVFTISNGSLIINAEKTQILNIYAVSGQLVQSVNVVAGDNEVKNLSKGLYLINNNKIIIK